MKTKVAFLSVFVMMITVHLSAQQGASQTLLISNLHHKKGKLYIGWYNKAEDFRLADRSVIKKIVEINGEEPVSVVFPDVAPGTYAVAIFLDENSNGKIDKNMFGIPKEKYGFSNNIYPLMRPATFKESSFLVQDKSYNIVIRLK